MTEDRCTHCGSANVDETGDTAWEIDNSTLVAWFVCLDCRAEFAQIYTTEFVNSYTTEQPKGA